MSVVDNGIGMSAETLANLLRPFEQADALATAIGGTLSIHSTLGAGTRAMVILPASLVRPASQAEAA
ncbi:MAG: hypothetical protein P1U65_01620 [Minwuia sp.]|nr:hypothetical protein [Minwuia sp.]